MAPLYSPSITPESPLLSRLLDWWDCACRLTIMVGLGTLLGHELHAQPQQHGVYRTEKRYQVIAKGREVGYLDAKAVYYPDSTCFFIESQSSINIIVKYEMAYQQTAVYRDGRLYHSHIVEKANDKEPEVMRLRWRPEKSSYEMIDAAGERQWIETPIHVCTASIYFRPPEKARSQVYALRQGAFLDMIRQEASQSYLLHLPNGRTNTYTYQRGQLKRVYIDHFLADIYIQP